MAGERTEKATPKRRSEARKKGQVARSQEVNSTAVLLAAAAALAVAGPAMAVEPLEPADRDHAAGLAARRHEPRPSAV